jgi:hypothetical protein
MLTLVYDSDKREPAELPPAGGALALLPGPALWVSALGQVVDANAAAIDLLLDVGEAASPLRDAIIATLADALPRQARINLNGAVYLFQIAPSTTTADPHQPCVVAVGLALEDGA